MGDHRVLQPPKRDHPRAAEPASGLASLSFRHSWHPMGRPEYRPLACQPRSLDDPLEVQRSPSRWPLRRPPRPRRTHRRGLSRLRDRPQLRLRANKLPSPNHCESRDFLLVFKNLSLKVGLADKPEVDTLDDP